MKPKSETYNNIASGSILLGVIGLCIVTYQMHWAVMVTFISLFFFLYASCAMDAAKEAEKAEAATNEKERE